MLATLSVALFSTCGVYVTPQKAFADDFNACGCLTIEPSTTLAPVGETVISNELASGCCGTAATIVSDVHVGDMPFELNVLLTTRINELTDQGEKLAADNESLGSEKAKLESELAQLRQELEAAAVVKSELEKAQAQIAALKEAQKSLEAEKTTLAEQLNAKDSQIANLQAKIDAGIEAERLASAQKDDANEKSEGDESGDSGSEDAPSNKDALQQPAQRREGEQTEEVQPESDDDSAEVQNGDKSEESDLGEPSPEGSSTQEGAEQDDSKDS